MYSNQTHIHLLSEYAGMICTTVSTRAHSASGMMKLLGEENMEILTFVFDFSFLLGYGSLAPATAWGRVICVIYALLGIPLTLALLAIVGKILGDYINDACAFMLKWYRKVHKSYEYERT